VARGRSKAVFQGKIVVERDAQKTDAKLMMQGLMLSEEAEILSKPELEIFADDVVCGHGSTCGRLDEDSMFYLMSRGVPKAEAETMLIRGFLAELLDPIADEAVNAALQGVVDRWLARK
jgi:Fe-S cluster assembly protein SufD